MVHKGKSQDAYHTSMGIHAITANVVNACSRNATSKIEGWIRPPMSFVKLDVNASFDHVLRDTANVVFRDDKEKFIVGRN